MKTNYIEKYETMDLKMINRGREKRSYNKQLKV